MKRLEKSLLEDVEVSKSPLELLFPPHHLHKTVCCGVCMIPRTILAPRQGFVLNRLSSLDSILDQWIRFVSSKRLLECLLLPLQLCPACMHHLLLLDQMASVLD